MATGRGCAGGAARTAGVWGCELQGGLGIADPRAQPRADRAPVRRRLAWLRHGQHLLHA